MTRKELIKAVNDYFDAHYFDSDVKKERLYQCSAIVVKFKDARIGHLNFDYYVLRSYSTITAIYCIDTDMLYCFDYYSQTSSQHFCKFIKFLRNKGYDVDDINYLYERSDRTICIWQGKRYKIQKQDLLTDFAEWIEPSF